MTAIHKLQREQIIATNLNTAWEFIRRPQNLNRITPDDMTFEIISDVPEEMYNGLIIEYRIGIPLIGKQPWLSEIKHVKDHHSFVDEQRIGPYRLWYHYHEISEHTNGVRFVDKVHYSLPFGIIGSIAHCVYVKRQLNYIFGYREKAMSEVFSELSK